MNNKANIDQAKDLQMDTITLKKDGLKLTAKSLGQGPLVILLHGFPDTPDSFRHQMQALATAGYRAIAPTLRGYEPSSQSSDDQYYAIDVASDIIAWLDLLNADKAHIIGHDWGATIASAAANLDPKRWLSLTLMAVPHPGRFNTQGLKSLKQLCNSWYLFFFQLKKISDWLIQRNDFRFLEYLWEKWSPEKRYHANDIESVKEQFRQQGVLHASLSYYRLALDTRSTKGEQSQKLINSPIQVPTLGLTGASDGCINQQVFIDCMQQDDFPEGLEVIKVDKAGHFLQLEQPEAVSMKIINWISNFKK